MGLYIHQIVPSRTRSKPILISGCNEPKAGWEEDGEKWGRGRGGGVGGGVVSVEL